jgi:agmatinase
MAAREPSRSPKKPDAKPEGKAAERIRYEPVNPRKSPRFGEIATFNRLPYIPDLQGKEVDVAILGIPYDGAVTYRPGARFGPRAVRDASVLNRNYNPQQDVLVYDRLNVVDAGDVPVNPLNFKQTLRNIEKRLGEVHAAGARAICVGGDHSVALGELRATHRKFGPLTLIHFDAHTDAGDQAWGEKYHHGTWIRRGIEEGILRGPRIFQIGIRQPLTTREEHDYLRAKKISWLDMDSFTDPRARDQFFGALRQAAGTGPCFVSFDVDGVDPAFAPGTGTPVVGGMTSYEALTCVRRLRGLRVVGADVVEIAPAYDHAELTSLLGAALVFELLALMAL